jgi:hypothetical protein
MIIITSTMICNHDHYHHHHYYHYYHDHPGMQLHHKDVMICYRAYRSQSKLRELLQRKPTIDEVAHDIGKLVDTIIAL